MHHACIRIALLTRTAFYAWLNLGGGYVISNAALRLIAPHALNCGTEWPAKVFEDASVAYCFLKHTGIKCKGMQQAFSWDIFQNAHGPNAAKKLEMVNLTLGPSELGAAVTIHPVPPDLQQRVHDTITGFRSEFQHRIDIVRYGNNAVAP